MKKRYKCLCGILVLLLVLTAFGLTACGDSDKFTDEFSQVLFDHLSRLVEQRSELKINSIIGYYYDYHYYYCVDFEMYSKYEGSDGGWIKLDKVYVYGADQFKASFDSETRPTLFEFYYNNYKVAVEKGDKKVYENSEIESYLEKAFTDGRH